MLPLSPAFARAAGESGLSGLGPHCSCQGSPRWRPGFLVSFPALWRAWPLSEKPVPEPGLGKQQQETLARLAFQWKKANEYSSLVRGWQPPVPILGWDWERSPDFSTSSTLRQTRGCSSWRVYGLYGRYLCTHICSLTMWGSLLI